MAELDKIIEEKKASAGILEYIFGTLAVFAAVPFVLAYYICVIIINIIKLFVYFQSTQPLLKNVV